MKQELIIQQSEFGELYYHPGISGQIELCKLTDSLFILKLFFQKLRIIDKPEDMYFDRSTEVMLSNYPIKINSLAALDGMEIFIEEGFNDDALMTMLSIHDGEPINKSRIKFKMLKEEAFEIHWTGCWGEGNDDDENFMLSIVAHKEENIITPLCESTEDLIKKFDPTYRS